MKNNVNISYNGYGIVNNRGASKYWGVTPHPEYTGKWRVSACLNNKTYTFSLPHFVEDSELFCAHIAKFLYKYRDYAVPNSINIPHMMDYTFVYKINFINKTIISMSACDMGSVGNTKVETFYNPLKIDQDNAATNDVFATDKQVYSMIKRFELNETEQFIIRQFVEDMLDNNISDKCKEIVCTVAKVFSE